MTAIEAQFLRDRWRVSGHTPCEHPLADIEYDDTEHITGNYVCTICGMIVRVRAIRRIAR